MRWIINYIRQCFCKHELELLKEAEVCDEVGDLIGEKWIWRCKKCGYSKVNKDY